MAIGFPIFLITLGALLRWAVGGSVLGVSLGTLGLILMIAGVVGGLIALVATSANADADHGRTISRNRSG